LYIYFLYYLFSWFTFLFRVFDTFLWSWIHFSDWYHFVLMPFWLVRISIEIDFIIHCHVVIFY
jgi:hypothetical protein